MRQGKRTLIASKRLGKRLADDRLIDQIKTLCSRSIGKSLAARGWTVRKPSIVCKENGGYHFTATVSIVRSAARSFSEEQLEKGFATICSRFARYAPKKGWHLGTDAGPLQTSIKEEKPSETEQIEVTPDCLSGWEDSMEGIFARDAQLRDIKRAITTALSSNFNDRCHLLLWGSPGCGKSEALSRLEKLLGELAFKMDATMLTQAGAVNLLLDYEGPLPRFLLLEEIEKADENNLHWLLGLMDERKELIKTNARIGCRRREAACLVIATANNLGKLRNGSESQQALASRFGNKQFWPRPSRGLLKLILEREVGKMHDGRKEWIEPALHYGIETEGTLSARRLIAILKTGKDDLLSGDYQKDQGEIFRQMQAEMGDEFRVDEA